MLTKEKIEKNKVEYISLLKKITREGAMVDNLIKKLENSDFFTAPASTKYHGSYEGGLCEHSLDVYNNLKKIIDSRNDLDNECYYEDSIIIVALGHDISKMNLYEKTVFNKKVYSPVGSKSDEVGRFDWVAEPGFKIKETCFVYGNHECTSEYILRQYIPLTIDESVAILHHMGSMSFDSAKDDIGKVYTNYQLACALYLADMMATYFDRRVIKC